MQSTISAAAAFAAPAARVGLVSGLKTTPTPSPCERASLFVAGNAVFGDPDPAEAYRRLRAAVA